ncbi:hypothetical protein ACHMW6_06065 [Pseudoduganella sp. UC29_106]|uniref:hypothetical protein n=1 Tax=Pseudoduganella sp. UC29_106 TaxID=3374553 RepID=UPI003757C8E7
MTDNENKPAAVLEPKFQTKEYAQYECHHCGSGLTVHKASAVPELFAEKTIPILKPTQSFHPFDNRVSTEAVFVEVTVPCRKPAAAAPQAEEAPAGISIQDLVAERRKDPRKAAALDRVKDAHSAAAAPEHVQPSIADDPEFRAMYLTCAGTLLWTEEGFRQKTAYIDAKLTQARVEGAEPYCDLVREICFQLSCGGYNSEGLMPVETARQKIAAGIDMLVQPWRERAIKAEAQLAAIRAGVEGLAAYSREMRGGQHGRIGFEDFYATADVLTLFRQPAPACEVCAGTNTAFGKRCECKGAAA